jgi:putative colanic acid biosynthesis UDP-glucose lipid carrier transferase
MALLALSLFLPILLVAMVVIWAETGAPIFFRQHRTGRDGRIFSILKFRTMTVVEDGETILQAQRGDARITRVGRVLRRFSIDELPQLINVIAGDMSMVGPRPHAVAHDQEFMCRVPEYAQRFRVRPGITGLAQVSGLRGEIVQQSDIILRTAADNRYIDNWSLGSDMWILARTAKLVLRDPHAF